MFPILNLFLFSFWLRNRISCSRLQGAKSIFPFEVSFRPEQEQSLSLLPNLSDTDFCKHGMIPDLAGKKSSFRRKKKKFRRPGQKQFCFVSSNIWDLIARVTNNSFCSDWLQSHKFLEFPRFCAFVCSSLFVRTCLFFRRSFHQLQIFFCETSLKQPVLKTMLQNKSLVRDIKGLKA